MFTEDEKKIISERLKTLRKRKGFTQEKVADKLSFVREHYSRIEERGEHLTLYTLQKLAEIFETSVSYILGLTENEKPDYEVIGDSLGLNDKSIETLKQIKAFSEKYNTSDIDYINLLLSDFNKAINFIENFGAYTDSTQQKYYLGIPNSKEKKQHIPISELNDFEIKEEIYLVEQKENNYIFMGYSQYDLIEQLIKNKLYDSIENYK